MDFAQALQFYTPLAGLVLMAFWLGVLSNRVSTLEREERDRKSKDHQALDERDRIVRMETNVATMTGKLESIERGMAGVQRQLASVVTTRTSSAFKLESEG